MKRQIILQKKKVTKITNSSSDFQKPLHMRKTTFALPDIIFLKFFKQTNEKNGTAITNGTSTISTL